MISKHLQAEIDASVEWHKAQIKKSFDELRPKPASNAPGGIRVGYMGNGIVCTVGGGSGGGMPSTHSNVSIARRLWGAA